MYRQIQIHHEDQNFQLIIWRENPQQPLKIFRLTTITYGESCSPYLALRTLQELVTQEGALFPAASEVIEHCRYVDDLLFGHNDLQSLKALKSEVEAILEKGCFILKKWATNHEELVDGTDRSSLANPLLLSDDNSSLKTLGIAWYPVVDSFSFTFLASNPEKRTKRTLLSDSSRLYDPLGWLAPIILKFKVLFQETWIKQVDWDSALPDEILEEWNRLRIQLPLLHSLRIDRYFGHGRIELHGFSDASQLAYAAAVYIRIIPENGPVKVSLVMAKTKLAPIKPLSIPRLELCAAHLLTKLVNHVRYDFPGDTPVFLWSDSSTVLAWIKSFPRRWSTFVGNRIGLIHELCPGVPWFHVKSNENPADVASRGSYPNQLILNELWWHGPSFLSMSALRLETAEFNTNEEAVSRGLNHMTVKPNIWQSLVDRCSSFNRLLRIVAFIFRISDRAKHRLTYTSHSLSCDETKRALMFLISQIQQGEFRDEISRLSSGQPLSKSSKLVTLDPFLDDNHILCVRGRLQSANCSEFNSTPMVLPKGKFSQLIIEKTHLDTFHGGLRVVCAQIRSRFWIIGLQASVKRHIQSCVSCLRYRAKTYEPTMGQLPKSRVTPSKPFATTGVDFAGPIILRPYKGKGKISIKTYIALFVCCSTKAVHLELIMGLDVSCLIMGIRRFIARRGRCEQFLSDHGRNFVACSRILKTFKQELRPITESPELTNFLAQSFIAWKFIPPYSPHFGGLWESGIKSVKGHLHRMFHGHTFTIEEVQTALCQIESILNSRPLVPLSFSEPLIAISPAHLLTGQPMSCFPDIELPPHTDQAIKIRYTAIQNLVKGFWKTWRNEYLDTLMRKPKWNRTHSQPKLDDIVLIKRSFDPPMHWSLGRITQLYPGPDHIIRVVEVRTSKGSRKESVRHLIPILVDAGASTGGSMDVEIT